MTRSNLSDMLSVLEEIRAKDFPEIPSEVIEKIVYAQYDNQDNRSQARTETMKIISEFMSAVRTEGIS